MRKITTKLLTVMLSLGMALSVSPIMASADSSQESSENTSVITKATIEDVRFSYGPGDTPVASALVTAVDYDKYEVSYECWQQFENNDPVAAWYSDNGSHGSLPTFTKFESGKSYVYSLMLKPKDGYSFSSNTVITVNGQKVSAPFVGGSMYVPSIKTITISTVTVIDEVEINGATLSFKNGDKPVFTGNVPDGSNYALRAMWWELDSKTGLISTEPEFGGEIYENKITAFEAGKTYHYGVYLVAYGDVGNVRYVFGPDTKLKINGEFVNYQRYEGDTSDGSDGTMWVITDLTMAPKATDAISDNKDTSSNNSTSTDSKGTSSNNSTNTNSKAPAKNNAGSTNPNTGNNVGGIAFAILIAGGGLVVAGRKSRKNK